jgi:hypothetical protein
VIDETLVSTGVIQYLDAFSSAQEPCALEQDDDGAPPPRLRLVGAEQVLPPKSLY